MDSAEVEVTQEDEGIREPEGRVPDLDLSEHLEGYWPSSKNVTQ
jgi:hypothetical protein